MTMPQPSVPGLRQVLPFDEEQGAAIPVALVYPSSGRPRQVLIGPYELHAVEDGPVVGRDLPLVLVSHGNGGSPWAYRDMAIALAAAGFCVALVDHVGNSRTDNTLAGTAENLANRPRHLRLAIDAAFAAPELGPHLRPGRVAVIGHSMGGYTALAVAGGQPWTEASEGEGDPVAVSVEHDPRIAALVLMTPATRNFGPKGSLSRVRVPILLKTGDLDEVAPSPVTELVKRDIDAALIEHAPVANAGHFSFMSPVPAALASPDFPPAQDPPGFDRQAYLPVLHAEIVDFLRRVL